MSADHIGPISLGFIHDPINFQAVCSNCNSRKNNRLTQEDINKIISREHTGQNMISWWARDCWNNTKKLNEPTKIKKSLDTNAKKFLCIMNWLKNNNHSIVREFIMNEYLNLDSSYKIDSIEVLDNGDIKYHHTETTTNKKTKDVQRERTIEILLEKGDKINRKIKIQLTDAEIDYLSNIEIHTFKNRICKILQGL